MDLEYLNWLKNNMLIQKIQWWLWNQMFQYAFIKALSLRNKVDFKLDISEYKTYFRPYELEVFNIEKKYAKLAEIPFYERYNFDNKYLSYISNILIKPIFSRLNKNHKIDNNLKYDETFLHQDSWYFDGFFQCEKYFKDFSSEIRKDFTFRKELSSRNIKFLESIKWKNSVCVHVRRWDYLNLKDVCNICWLDYYNKAMKLISEKIKDPVFLFFSDDSKRVKENFKWNNYMFIDWNKWKDSWQDMALMSKCKHNIIANSSFSWWGGWLNDNIGKIVIVPKKPWNGFNKNYYPTWWVKL